MPQKIIKKMEVMDKNMYLIKYKGLCNDYNQWVEEGQLQDLDSLIAAFDSRHSLPGEDSTLKCQEM